MGDYTLTPYIRLAWDHTVKDLHWYLKPRVIFDYEIIFLQDGEIDLMVEEEHYHVVPTDFIILRPMKRHSIRSVGKVKVHQPHIHFDLQQDEYSSQVYIPFEDLDHIPLGDHKFFRQDILDEICPNLPPVLHLKNYKRIQELFMKIIREKENRMVYSEPLANGLFLLMFSLLLREYTIDNIHEKNKSLDVAWKVQEYLNQNLNKNISLDDISHHIHVSKYYLCHEFKQVFGVSPIQYHQDSRIEHAKYLLTTTQLPIGTIAEIVGFQNIYSFSKAFKKKEHVSPSVYRMH